MTVRLRIGLLSVRLLVDAETGLLVEEVERARVDGDLDRVPYLHARARVEAADDGGAVRAGRLGRKRRPTSSSSSRSSSVSAAFASIETCTRISEPSASCSTTVAPHPAVGGRAVSSAASLEALGPHADTTMRPSKPRIAGCASSVSSSSTIVSDADRRRVSLAGPADRRLDEVHRRAADEARHEEVDGPVVQLLGRGDLLQLAAPHHRHAVAHRHRLDLVVRDVDRGDARAPAGAARSRRASARAASRRGSRAARPSGTPAGGARSRAPSRRAGAGRRRARAACGRAATRARASSRRPAPAGRSRASAPSSRAGRTRCSRTR